MLLISRLIVGLLVIPFVVVSSTASDGAVCAPYARPALGGRDSLEAEALVIPSLTEELTTICSTSHARLQRLKPEIEYWAGEEAAEGRRWHFASDSIEFTYELIPIPQGTKGVIRADGRPVTSVAVQIDTSESSLSHLDLPVLVDIENECDFFRTSSGRLLIKCKPSFFVGRMMELISVYILIDLETGRAVHAWARDLHAAAGE